MGQNPVAARKGKKGETSTTVGNIGEAPRPKLKNCTDIPVLRGKNWTIDEKVPRLVPTPGMPARGTSCNLPLGVVDKEKNSKLGGKLNVGKVRRNQSRKGKD